MSGKMYEKRPEEDARYHDTWRLLKKYRDVTWSLELSIRQVKNQFRIDYDCSIEDFLESIYMAGADLGGTDIENHARCIERSYKMLTLLENSVNLLRTHHQSGEVYADEQCPGGELPVPVHVLGEELCACGVIPDLSRKISVIRSRNLSMSCVFQNLAGLQNRYPYNQWQEILGNCDVQLFLGCTDALTAEFISDRTGEASISVTSKAKQLGTWRVSNYTPEYRETSGVGRRKLMTMDEVLRMDIDKALILIRGKNVLEVDKYDYSKHPEAKKLRPSKAASHVPAWRANQPQEKQTPSAPPSQAAEKKPAQKKKPAPAEKVVAVTKESIMKKKEDT